MSDALPPPVEGDDPRVRRAVAILRRGGLVALPTETVYGLAGDARSDAAIARIFEAKGRPAGRPLPVLLPGADALPRWASRVPDAARALAARFWPGPLTLVVPRPEGLPPLLTAGAPTLGVRVPDHPLALAVLRAFGDGLATPSANRHAHVSPTSAQAVRDDLGDAVDLVLDGGPCAVGVESTVVDVSGDRPVILRAGALSPEALDEALGAPGAVLRASAAAGGTTSFRPRTPLTWVAPGDLEAEARRLAADGARVAALGADPAAAWPPGLHAVPLPADPAARAAAFYAALRAADALGADRLLAERLDGTHAGRVIMERLGAAAP